MAFELKQSLRLTQQLLMTPQLQQAIKLLQLSRMELEQFVATQLAENPCLEEGVSESQEEVAQAEREQERTEEQVISDQIKEASSIVDSTGGDDKDGGEADWEAANRYQEQQASSSTASRKNASDEEHPNYENMVTKANTLQEHLMSQVGELDFDEQEQKIATVLIGNIDDRGYLLMTTQEIATNESFEVDQVEERPLRVDD